MLVACGMAVGAAVLLGRRVVRPIEVLRQGAARLEAGDLEARLNLKSGDEFEELADDFNRMASRLQEAYADLERKVEERTQALQRSLEQVQALGDTIRAVSASLDLQNVLQTIVIHATDLSNSDGGLIYEFDEAAQVFRFRAGHLLRPELIASLESEPPTFRDSIVGRAAVTGLPEQISDIAEDTSYPLEESHRRGRLPLAPRHPDHAGQPVDRRHRSGAQGGRRLHGAGDRSVAHIRQRLDHRIVNARLFHEVERKNMALRRRASTSRSSWPI